MYAPRTLVALSATAVLATTVAVAVGTATADASRPDPAPPQLLAHGSDFAQLSSAVDQKQDGTVNTVRFEQVDGRRGVDVTKDSVTVRRDGTYLMVVAPQVFTGRGGVQQGRNPTRGCVDTWFAVNGKDVPNSGVRLCQAADHSTHVVVSQSVSPLKAGDVLQVRAKGEDVTFDATRPTDGPLIPSVIFSLARLD